MTQWIETKVGMPALVHRDDKLVRLAGRVVPACTTSEPVLILLNGINGRRVAIDSAVHVDGSDTIIWETYGGNVTHWMPLPALPDATQNRV